MIFKPLQRSTEFEILDGPVDDEKAFQRAVTYLEWSNRWLGNNWLIKHHLKPFIDQLHGGTFTVLDIGTGVGDIPRMLARWAKKHQFNMRIIGVDPNPDVIAIARERAAEYDNITFYTIEELERSDEEIHIAILSQVLHHLTPEEAVDILRETYQHVTQGIIISDLVRSRIAHAMVWLVVALTSRSRIARKDGALSVYRAYSNAEIREILRKAGIRDYATRVYMPRRAVLIDKKRLEREHATHFHIDENALQ